MAPSLARELHDELGGPGVGAVGMCFTGGFALAMLADAPIAAPVLAQPASPFPVGRRRSADLGLGPRRRRGGPGQGRRRVPGPRRPVRDDRPSGRGSRRSAGRWGRTSCRRPARVPARHADGAPRRAAVTRVLDFFDEKLGTGSGP